MFIKNIDNILFFFIKYVERINLMACETWGYNDEKIKNIIFFSYYKNDISLWL